MAKEKDSRLDNFPKKWANVLNKICNQGEMPDEFLDNVQQCSKEELDQLIVKHNELIADFKKDREEDQDLASAKERYQEAGMVYKEGISINEAKAMYCVYLKKSL
jgi:hypothetical protein